MSSSRCRLHESVAHAFATASALDVAPTEPAVTGLEAYGVLDAQVVEDVRALTLRDTVRSFADALIRRVVGAGDSAATTTP